MPVRRDEFLPYFDQVRRLRRNNRALCYGIAIAGVALAGLARWALEGVLITGIPFITFFPAILVVTFIGGLGSWAVFSDPLGGGGGLFVHTALLFILVE